MTVTVIKTTFEKLKPRVSYFRNWNEFCNEKFRIQLLTKLSLENFNSNRNGINKFPEICVNTLEIYLHLAGKNTCGEIINKSLVKAHRKRTRLRKKFLKNRTDQKTLLQKTKFLCKSFEKN